MIQIVKKKKPNSERIKTLREANNLSQEQLLQRMKEDLGYTMSRRTYQRIEKGDDVQPKYLDYIIKFYDRKNIKLKIDELVSENTKKKKQVGKATKSSSLNDAFGSAFLALTLIVVFSKEIPNDSANPAGLSASIVLTTPPKVCTSTFAI